MNEWIKYLRESLKTELPEDLISSDHKYGRIRDNIKIIIPCILEQWTLGLLSLVFILVASVLTFPAPMIMRYLINDVLLKKNLSMLCPVIALLIIVYVASAIFSQIKTFISTRFNQKVTIMIQNNLFDRVFSLPKSFFDNMHRGYLLNRLTSDVTSVSWFFSAAISEIILQSIKLVGGIIFLFYLEWRIAIPIAISLPIPIFISKYFARRNYFLSHKSKERSATFSSFLQEIISSAILIKSFSRENRTKNLFSEQLNKNYDIQNQSVVLNALYSNIVQLLPGLAKLITLIFGSYWIIKGEWSIGSLVAYLAYLGYVYGPAMYISGFANQLAQARASLERVSGLYNIVPEMNVNDGIFINFLHGNIEFRDLSFSYIKDEYIFKNLSFPLRKGEHLAVVGLSGIGKTTLISLIMRFYIPTSGTIYFDDKDINKLNVRSLRERIGYVSQKTELLSGTIKYNLLLGNENASEKNVIKACQISEIDSFINSLACGYHTEVAECGANLSEGQKQRLSIARALVKDADIYILDEPTASIDNPTEKSIYNSISSVFKNKTVIIITHRLSTVNHSDKVLFLIDNQNYLFGNHNELMQNVCYKDFFSME